MLASGCSLNCFPNRTIPSPNPIDNPRWLQSNLRKLRVTQRRVSRRTKGGAHWRKAVKQVAKQHEKAGNGIPLVLEQKKDIDTLLEGLPHPCLSQGSQSASLRSCPKGEIKSS